MDGILKYPINTNIIKREINKRNKKRTSLGGFELGQVELLGAANSLLKIKLLLEYSHIGGTCRGLGVWLIEHMASNFYRA